jgi:transcription elongation factor Elf1
MCPKCKSKTVSISKDGHLGERVTCLKCGTSFPLKQNSINKNKKGRKK